MVRIKNTGLTDREKEIVILLMEGQKAEDVAKKLVVSKRTIDAHKRNIFEKLGVHNMMEMSAYVRAHNLL